MTEAPPDDIRRQFVLSEHIIATFLVEGPKCTPHTPNIAHALREIKTNKRFKEFLDRPETNTSYPVLACQKVIAVVKGATEEWSHLLKRTDEAYLSQCEGRPLLETADGASEALSAWYKKFESDTREEPGEIEDYSHPIERTRALEDFLSPAKVTIMQCTCCSRPSALLKKCKQCGKVKYCDSECQKAHWKRGHKSVCASSVAPVPRQ